MNVIWRARQPVQKPDSQECFHSKMKQKSDENSTDEQTQYLNIISLLVCVHWPFCLVKIIEPIMPITLFHSDTDCCLCCSETVMEQCQGNFLTVIFNLLNSS